MPSAARLGDLIGHVPPIPPDARGPGGPGGVPTGEIIRPCSGKVFINGRPAARASIDPAVCALHPPIPLPIASGSSNVFINGLPAARRGDLIKCGAVIITGSGNVFIGGGVNGGAGSGSVQTELILPEEAITPLMLQSLQLADAGAASLRCEADQAKEIAAFNARNAQSQLIPIGAVEAFFTFNTAGRFMKGWANGAADIVSSPVTAVAGAWHLAADAYGYGKQALLGPEKGVMGDLRPYQPRSAIVNAFKVNGVANTMGGALHSTVMGATGLSLMQAIGSRDPETIGRAGPGILLAIAGGSMTSRLSGANSIVQPEILAARRPGIVIKNGGSGAIAESSITENSLIRAISENPVSNASYRRMRFPRQTGHSFHGKLDTWSSANWTRIPRQTGHLVQRKLDTDSAPSLTV